MAAESRADPETEAANKAAAKAAVKKTGVTARDKMRELLAESLAMALPDVVRCSASLGQLASCVSYCVALLLHYPP